MSTTSPRRHEGIHSLFKVNIIALAILTGHSVRCQYQDATTFGSLGKALQIAMAIPKLPESLGPATGVAKWDMCRAIAANQRLGRMLSGSPKMMKTSTTDPQLQTIKGIGLGNF